MRPRQTSIMEPAAPLLRSRDRRLVLPLLLAAALGPNASAASTLAAEPTVRPLSQDLCHLLLPLQGWTTKAGSKVIDFSLECAGRVLEYWCRQCFLG